MADIRTREKWLHWRIDCSPRQRADSPPTLLLHADSDSVSDGESTIEIELPVVGKGYRLRELYSEGRVTLIVIPAEIASVEVFRDVERAILLDSPRRSRTPSSGACAA